MPDEFMTVAEIAAILKLNQQTVRNWIDAGKLPAVHIGRRVRIKRSDFDRWWMRGTRRPKSRMPHASGTGRFRTPTSLSPRSDDLRHWRGAGIHMREREVRCRHG